MSLARSIARWLKSARRQCFDLQRRQPGRPRFAGGVGVFAAPPASLAAVCSRKSSGFHLLLLLGPSCLPALVGSGSRSSVVALWLWPTAGGCLVGAVLAISGIRLHCWQCCRALHALVFGRLALAVRHNQSKLCLLALMCNVKTERVTVKLRIASSNRLPILIVPTLYTYDRPASQA